MIQNIRSPQDTFPLQHQSENAAKPIRREDSKADIDVETSSQEATPTREQVTQAAARVAEVLRGTTSRIEIDIDPDLNRAVIKIFNGESGEIIRQIPAKELVELAKYLDEPKGVLVSERA